MIKTIIFDFGNVFINLDEETAFKKTLNTLKIDTLTEDITTINKRYEIGEISTKHFIAFYKQKFPNLKEQTLIDLWNLILKDFPKNRLSFLKTLKASKKFKLILLSNTNELHINWIKEHISFYEDFKNTFNAFYLSHEVHLRKPNPDIFEFVLNEHNLKPEECLFIDDKKENTDTANQLGIHIWCITPNKEDVIHLFETHKDLF